MGPRGPNPVSIRLLFLMYSAVGAGQTESTLSPPEGGEKGSVHTHGNLRGYRVASTRLGSGAGKATDVTGGSRMAKASDIPARPAPPSERTPKNSPAVSAKAQPGPLISEALQNQVRTPTGTPSEVKFSHPKLQLLPYVTVCIAAFAILSVTCSMIRPYQQRGHHDGHRRGHIPSYREQRTDNAGPGNWNKSTPPSWGPEMQRDYTFRAFLRDVSIWVEMTDLLPAQQAMAIQARLTGSARDAARSITLVRRHTEWYSLRSGVLLTTRLGRQVWTVGR